MFLFHAVIEVDGDYWHSLPNVKERDSRKDKYLKSKGINVVHIKECELKTNDIIINRWEQLTGQKAELQTDDSTDLPFLGGDLDG